MDANPSKHYAWRARTRCLIAGGAVASALFAGTLFPVPARAITTQTEAKLTETQKNVEDSATAYDAATKKLDDLQAKMEENEADIEKLESQLPAAQEKASRAMRELYKYKRSSNTFMSFILNSESLSDLITAAKYMGQVEKTNVDAVEDLNNVQAELETKKAEIAAAKAQAETEKQQASDALAEAQKLRDEAQAKADAESASEASELAAAVQAARQQAAANGGTAKVQSVQQVSSANVNWNQDEASFVAEWAPRIDAYLAGSPLAGYGKNFAQAAWKYGVDPRFSPAIANTESTKGANCFLPHNAWGWGSSSWSSWAEAIDEHVAGLARGYGYTISTAAAQKYCPPNWLAWYNNTSSQMNLI